MNAELIIMYWCIFTWVLFPIEYVVMNRLGLGHLTGFDSKETPQSIGVCWLFAPVCYTISLPIGIFMLIAHVLGTIVELMVGKEK